MGVLQERNLVFSGYCVEFVPLLFPSFTWESSLHPWFGTFSDASPSLLLLGWAP